MRLLRRQRDAAGKLEEQWQPKVYARLVVLAVVEPVSYRAGHVPGSINIWRPDYELKALIARACRRPGPSSAFKV